MDLNIREFPDDLAKEAKKSAIDENKTLREFVIDCVKLGNEFTKSKKPIFNKPKKHPNKK